MQPNLTMRLCLLAAALGLASGLVLFGLSSIEAAVPGAPIHTFTVNSTADTHDTNKGNGACADGAGNCTLRAAFEEANAWAGDDTVVLPGGTYSVTLGEIKVTSSVTLNGASQASTFIDGTGNNGVAFSVLTSTLVLSQLTLQKFTYISAIYNDHGTVTLDNCALTDNASTHGWSLGGAIENEGGTIHITNYSTLSYNSARDGGAIYNHDGIVDISHFSVLNGNQATRDGGTGGWGGAIESSGGSVYISFNSRLSGNSVVVGGGAIAIVDGILSISSSQLDGNTVGVTGWDGGGAIQSHGSTVSIESSEISENSAPDGGAIYITDDGVPNSQVTILNSSLNGNNTIDGNGGAIWIEAPAGADILRLTNSTLSGNTSPQNGGGLYMAGGVVRISSSTIVSNTADVDSDEVGNGGGIYVLSGTLNIKNTLIALNKDASNGTFAIVQPDCYGSIVSGGYNLIGWLPGFCTMSGDTTGNRIGTIGAPIDPRLEVLGYHGYSTQHHPLKQNSPAIDGGNPGGCRDHAGVLLGSDQRGEPRPYAGKLCDIGAYESFFQLPHIYMPLLHR